MESLDAARLPAGSVLLLDSPPVIYMVEAHPRFSGRYDALFERHAAGQIFFAVTTVTLAEVLVGPMRKGLDVLAKRYRATLESWRIVDLTAEVAEVAASVRARHNLRLPDAVQVAAALSINAYAIVTHDRDFANLTGLRILF